MVSIKSNNKEKIKKHCEGVKHNANVLRYNNVDSQTRETGESDDKYHCGHCDKYMLNTLKSINRHELSVKHNKKVGTYSIFQDNKKVEQKHHCYTCDVDIQNTKFYILRHENGPKHQKNMKNQN
tara:strand:+ start:584 stop:955 length:372 start_codon:yes stop_codon:yes gene_type:complete